MSGWGRSSALAELPDERLSQMSGRIGITRISLPLLQAGGVDWRRAKADCIGL